jgi:hypothetical protein
MHFYELLQRRTRIKGTKNGSSIGQHFEMQSQLDLKCWQNSKREAFKTVKKYESRG